MIDIKLIINMLGMIDSSEIKSEELSIAKGEYNLPMTYNEFKQYLKLRKNGN